MFVGLSRSQKDLTGKSNAEKKGRERIFLPECTPWPTFTFGPEAFLMNMLLPALVQRITTSYAL